MAFRLHKWYLDAVDPTGQVFIGYWAHLKWGWLRLHYHGYVLKLIDQPIQSVNLFRSSSPPHLHDNSLQWNVSGIRGSWQRSVSPVEARLLDSPAGMVSWRAHLPRASVQLQFQDETRFEGLGYVEELEMTLPPWKLPIQRLHWGRSLARDHAIVWIRWESPGTPLLLVVATGSDGQTQTYRSDISINEDSVVFPGHRLSWQKEMMLRSGNIAQTVFQRLGWIKHLFPRSIRNLQETKWLSRSSLECNDGPSLGWTIHEIVDW